MIALEVVNLLAKRKEKAFMLKLDFQKAFYSISWQFLEVVMVKMGFNYTWLLWIHVCISIARVSILLIIVL